MPVQSAMLVFQSDAFPPELGEDEHTNPGVYGKSLAHWVSTSLDEAKWDCGEPFAEDWGWCIPVDSNGQSIFIACQMDNGAQPELRVFCFADSGFLAGLLGTKSQLTAIVNALLVDIQQLIETRSDVHGLSVESS
jgi:hypothetical protein